MERKRLKSDFGTKVHVLKIRKLFLGSCPGRFFLQKCTWSGLFRIESGSELNDSLLFSVEQIREAGDLDIFELGSRSALISHRTTGVDASSAMRECFEWSGHESFHHQHFVAGSWRIRHQILKWMSPVINQLRSLGEKKGTSCKFPNQNSWKNSNFVNRKIDVFRKLYQWETIFSHKNWPLNMKKKTWRKKGISIFPLRNNFFNNLQFWDLPLSEIEPQEIHFFARISRDTFFPPSFSTVDWT